MRDQGNENVTGVGPAILITSNYLKKKCLENEANRQITSYSYCNKIYMPTVHRETKSRKRLNQSTYYKKGKPRENHVKSLKFINHL